MMIRLVLLRVVAMVVYVYDGDGDNDGDDDDDGRHLANIAFVHEPGYRVLLVSTLKGNLDSCGWS